MGNLRLRLGKTEAALAAYEASMNILQRLAELDPQNSEFQRDLWVSRFNLGNVHEQLKITDVALGHFQEARRLLLLQQDAKTLTSDDAVYINTLNEKIDTLTK